MNKISQSLSSNQFCILFLTEANKNENWILFEAGAIYKGLDSNRVFTFLIDLSYSSLKPPLANLNHTIFDKNDILKLLRDINDLLPEQNKLLPQVLNDVFELNWPNFDKEFQKIIEENKEDVKAPTRTTEDMVKEILITVRGLDTKVQYLALNNPSSDRSSPVSPMKPGYPVKYFPQLASRLIDEFLKNDLPIEVKVNILKSMGLGDDEIEFRLKNLDPLKRDDNS